MSAEEEQLAAGRRRTPHLSIVVRDDQPLLGVVEIEDGREVARCFTDEPASSAVGPDDDIQAALSAIGAWSDLDWDEMAMALDRIRHDSKPTPPMPRPPSNIISPQ